MQNKNLELLEKTQCQLAELQKEYNLLFGEYVKACKIINTLKNNQNNQCKNETLFLQQLSKLRSKK